MNAITDGPKIDQGRLNVRRAGSGRPQILLQLVQREAGVLEHGHALTPEREAPSLGAQERQGAREHDGEHHERDHHLDERQAALVRSPGSRHGAATVTVRVIAGETPGPLTVTVTFL